MERLLTMGFTPGRFANHKAVFEIFKEALIKENKIMRHKVENVPLYAPSEGDYVIIDGDRPIYIVNYDITVLQKRGVNILVFIEMESNLLSLSILNSKGVYISYLDTDFRLVSEAWARGIEYTSSSLKKMAKYPLTIKKLRENERLIMLYTACNQSLEKIAHVCGYSDVHCVMVQRKRIMQKLGIEDINCLSDYVFDWGCL